MVLADIPIKCDATLPICRRCAKSKRPCHGMRTLQSRFQIHSENTYASGQEQRPRGPRTQRSILAADTSDVFLSRPLVDLKTIAVQYYLNCQLPSLENTPGIVKGISDDLMSTWASIGDSPMLELALSSLALMTFSRTRQHPPAAMEASVQYQRLLRTTHVALSSLDESNIDACLLANFLMSRYEDTIYNPGRRSQKASFTSTLSSVTHHDGGLAVLKIWKDRLSHIQPATDIIKYTRRGMIRSALIRNLTLPEWAADGFFFGERGMELEYDRLAVRITKVRKQLPPLLEQMNDPQVGPHRLGSAAERLDKEGRDIDEGLEKWAARLPTSWRGRRHDVELPHLSFPSRDFYSPVLYSHSSIPIASVWCHYYATRMLIISARLKILSVCHQNSSDNQQSECQSQMNAVANDLASTLPFCHERFKVLSGSGLDFRHTPGPFHTDPANEPYISRFLTAWPMTIASSLWGVDAALRLWFKSGLTQLGRAMGTGALECAGADRWLEI